MGIDLEQPSREYYKEDSRSNVSVEMVNAGAEESHTGGVTVNHSNVSCSNKENTRTYFGETEKDGRREVCAGDEIKLNSMKTVEPQEGMEFESKEEAFSFYKDYAKSVGFATIIKASRRSRISGKFIDAKFVCTRYGNTRKSSTVEATEAPNMDNPIGIPTKKKRGRINRSWSKTDCKACMHVKRRQEDGIWVIRSFIKEHNHEIFPDRAYYFRGHRNLDLGNSNPDALHAIRERTKRLFVTMSRKSGGYKKLDHQKGSVLNQSRAQHLGLEEGDAQVLLHHFVQMQDENPNFFYAIDLNEEQLLRNVLWVDAKSRLDCCNFGDVVFFDTTYIKNDYKLPFVPIIGVNHHFQFLLLGCALLADETKSTYIWLMRAWLRAMGGHTPSVILTDQDSALKEATAEAFPNSRHCFCLWHIFSKIPEKLSYVLRQHENFMTKFKKCIFKSFSNEQFEKRWWKIVDGFNLRNDMWFQSLYEDRERWMPIFMRDIFLAGMSTIQRSESINSFFDKHMQRKTTLKEFLDHYKAILQEKCEEEAKADFEDRHKQPGLKSPSPFGKQMAKVYTHAIFKKFQVEVLGVVACHPKKESEDGPTKMFRVQDFEENQDFIVLWNDRTSDISCLCRSFEFNGFLCRHVLIVLQMSGLHSIPSQYILTRWTKDARSGKMRREQSDVIKSRVQRYNDLCWRAFKLGDEGSLSQDSYNIVFSALEEALRKCEAVNNSIHSVTELTLPTQGPHEYEEVNLGDDTFKPNRRNNIPKRLQAHPEPEAGNITTRIHDSWQQMGHPNFCAPALECSYDTVERMQGMEQLNPRAPTLHGYFSTPQMFQGMGHLNSMAPSRDDFYSNQHNMHGLGQLNSSVQVHDAYYITHQRMPGMGQLHFRPQTIPTCFEIQDGLQDMDQSNVEVGPTQLHEMTSEHSQKKQHISR